MRAYHSDMASLFGFCECGCCGTPPRTQVGEDYSYPTGDLELYHLFMLRGRSRDALIAHRRELITLGFTVGPIVRSEKWDAWPRHWHKFKAHVLKTLISKETMDRLAQWDVANATLTEEEKSMIGH